MTARLAAAALVLASLVGCVSGRDCVNAIPEDLRADVMRMVVERQLCRADLMPEEDYSLALGGGGRPYEALDEGRRRQVAMYATGYASCVKERIER